MATQIERTERRISLNDMRVLMAVIQAGSMSKAAEQLATSQPAISRSISDLELVLGVRLLDRSPKGIEPTPYGRALAKRGVAVFDELRQGVKDIEFMADRTVGELRIGASVAIASGFVSTVIDRLSRRYPRLTFSVMASDTASVCRALVEREVDLSLVHLIGPFDAGELNADILCHDPHVVIAGARNPWVRRRQIKLGDLMNLPWTLPAPDTPYGQVVFEAFRINGLGVPQTVVTSTLPVRGALVATGRFFTMVPHTVLHFRNTGQGFKKLAIDLPTTRRPLAVVTAKHRTLNPVAEIFTDYARTLAKTLTKQ